MQMMTRAQPPLVLSIHMAEESALVARRCQEAKETRTVSLEGCGLRKFPDAIFFLLKDVRLQSVSLSGNQLQRIPAKLTEKFSTITSLDLSHNELSLLPSSLSNLSHLVHLSLSHNSLTEFPPPVPSLVTLEVESNMIHHITAAKLDEFPVLKRLNITVNPLTDESKTYLLSQDRVEVVL